MDRLVDELIAEGVLHTPAIIAAFRAIDRRDFVRPEIEDEAYSNIALPIGEGQTISQPLTVAIMLELLQPQAGNNILDIGSGSGWQTSLLAHIVGISGRVTALELVPSLCEWGRENVSHYNFIAKGIVEMRCMSGLGGYPPRAPFDKIIAAAAGEHVPDAWLTQTKIGGLIVAPIGSSVLQLLKTSEDSPTGEWERHEYPGFVFVPLL
ncbi:MAG TPA: methyltransferase domain-containing protein [Candidatus Andersenbacteria bacterium]|nr:methyltransferase domain-containing protein [Candidatus Andersenbacteria bacterium]